MCEYAMLDNPALLAIESLEVFMLHLGCPGIYPIQFSISMHYKRNSNITGGDFHLQTQFYSTLYTSMQCLFALMYNKSLLYTHTLHSATMHPKVVLGIVFSFDCGNVINPRFVDATLGVICFTHEVRVHRCRNAIEIQTTTKTPVCTRLCTYKFYSWTTLGRQRLEKGLYSVQCTLYFRLHDTMFALR